MLVVQLWMREMECELGKSSAKSRVRYFSLVMTLMRETKLQPFRVDSFL